MDKQKQVRNAIGSDLVVDVHEVAELLGQDPAPIVERQLAARHHHLHRLLQVAGGALQEAQHQVLHATNTRAR